MLRSFRQRVREKERGAVLILIAAGMAGFIGMAGFAVDLGWIYLQSSNVKKAAEAAALAAVSHMPLETPQSAGTVISTGIPAADTADDIATKHGYSAAATTAYRWATSAQVRVDISSSTETFFLKFFGIDTIDLDRHAIAEQLPPLKLGSDGQRLGTYYDNNGNLIDNEFFWLAINGEERAMADGDPFSTRCTGTSSGCSGTPNGLFRDPAYYYAVDVPGTEVGQAISVWVYDPENDNSGSDFTDDLGSSGLSSETFRFRLYPPDATPGDPSDNSTNGSIISGCNDSYPSSLVPDPKDTWHRVCQFTAASQGIHVLEVSVRGDDDAINGFSLAVTGATATTPTNTAVYGLGHMSLWMRDPGTSPTLQIVKLDEIYAGTELIVNAFDLGDITGNASGYVTFGGALAGVDCEIRTLNAQNSLASATAWGPDDSGSGSTCRVTTKSGSTGGNEGIYNNEWVEFKFEIPADFTCSDPNCWGTVTYTFAGGSPTDRTTWGARINGTPIHLLNESTPSG